MKTAVLAAALLLAMAAPAQAGWKINRATAVAGIVWNHPCNGQVRLAWAPLAHAAEAVPASCVVTFDATSEPTPWPIFCTDMLHEYGHLANFRDPLNPGDPYHSHKPNSVMYAFQTPSVASAVVDGRRIEEWSGVDRRCRENGRPYLEAHGLL